MLKKTICLLTIALLGLAACTSNSTPEAAAIATDTLAPIVSMTPRFTATPIPTRTPLPTYTFTPSVTPITPTPSDTPTPSATPPVTGIIASLQSVNVREGPGVAFAAIEALVPGTGVQVLGQNEDGKWLNIRLESGKEGWIAATLVRVNPLPTALPTSTPTPNLTALALGTPLPTAIFGGGTITPTPPPSVASPTPVGTAAPVTPELTIPVIDVQSIQLTATAMAAGGISLPTVPGPTATFTPLGSAPGAPTIPVIGVTATPGTASNSAQPDVGALCDNPGLGVPKPQGLVEGTTVDIYWAWFAKTRELLDQHVGAVTYQIAVDGVVLQNWRQYGLAVRQEGANYAKYWYVPYGPLTAGEHKVTYNASWSTAISDGYNDYGPGTANPTETGSCTFTVSPR